MTKQMKQPFYPEIDKPVFIKGINKKGIVKEAELATERSKVTYFSRENDQRITAWFSNSQLEEYRPKTKNKNNDYAMIRDVHIKFNSKVANTPTMLTRDEYCDKYGDQVAMLSTQMKRVSAAGHGGEVLARAAYIIEEISEFLKATTLKDQIDALGDGRYFIGGTTVMAGVDLDPIMKIINDSNLGKLWPDGKPRFDETGKWMKPDNWAKDHAPESKIEAEIKRQASCN